MKESIISEPSTPVREVWVMSPPSFDVMLPMCPVCGEYLANHWRRRACPIKVQP